jgi:hypothetical protein
MAGNTIKEPLKRRIERLEKQVLILAHFTQELMDWVKEQEEKKSKLILPN